MERTCSPCCQRTVVDCRRVYGKVSHGTKVANDYVILEKYSALDFSYGHFHRTSSKLIMLNTHNTLMNLMETNAVVF